MGVNEAIICLFCDMAAFHRKAYVFPSQKYILECLNKYYKIVISRRSLNRHLKRLEINGFFERVRRIRKGRDGKLVFASTLYKLREKTFKFTYSLLKLGKKFFSVFRVPNVAQYLFQKQKSISQEGVQPVDKPVDKSKNGPKKEDAPIGAPNFDLNLKWVREILKNLK